MNVMLSFFVAAGVAAFTYSKMGRRVGYGNTQNVFTIVAVVFVITLIVVYTLFQYVLHLS